MEMHEQNLPIISSNQAVDSNPSHGSDRLLTTIDSFALKSVLIKEYEAAGKLILEYRERLLASSTSGERISLETRLIIEEQVNYHEFETITASADASEVSPVRAKHTNAHARLHTRSLKELSQVLAHQLAGIKETGKLITNASTEIATRMTELRRGLSGIDGALTTLTYSDE